MNCWNWWKGVKKTKHWSCRCNGSGSEIRDINGGSDSNTIIEEVIEQSYPPVQTPAKPAPKRSTPGTFCENKDFLLQICKNERLLTNRENERLCLRKFYIFLILGHQRILQICEFLWCFKKNIFCDCEILWCFIERNCNLWNLCL